jgi:hypothetical protein
MGNTVFRKGAKWDQLVTDNLEKWCTDKSKDAIAVGDKTSHLKSIPMGSPEPFALFKQSISEELHRFDNFGVVLPIDIG